MPLLRITCQRGVLTHEQKLQLAEELTPVLVAGEVGVDNPAGRKGAHVLFYELDPETEWFLGGKPDTNAPQGGRFILEVKYVEGAATQSELSAVHSKMNEIVGRVLGVRRQFSQPRYRLVGYRGRSPAGYLGRERANGWRPRGQSTAGRCAGAGRIFRTGARRKEAGTRGARIPQRTSEGIKHPAVSSRGWMLSHLRKWSGFACLDASVRPGPAPPPAPEGENQEALFPIYFKRLAGADVSIRCTSKKGVTQCP